jgi:hypothetical protein
MPPSTDISVLLWLAFPPLALARTDSFGSIGEAFQDNHCTPEGIFTCTSEALLHRENAFVEGPLRTYDVTHRTTATSDNGAPLRSGHYIVEHPFFFKGTELLLCALNPIRKGTATQSTCADVLDSTVYDLQWNKNCTANKGVAHHSATAIDFGENPGVFRFHCEKKKKKKN